MNFFLTLAQVVENVRRMRRIANAHRRGFSRMTSGPPVPHVDRGAMKQVTDTNVRELAPGMKLRRTFRHLYRFGNLVDDLGMKVEELEVLKVRRFKDGRTRVAVRHALGWGCTLAFPRADVAAELDEVLEVLP